LHGWGEGGVWVAQNGYREGGGKNITKSEKRKKKYQKGPGKNHGGQRNQCRGKDTGNARKEGDKKEVN